MLTLEKFAQLRAEMEAGAERDALLRRESLTTAQWLAAQRQWLGAMAQEISRGERALAEQYLAAYVAAGGDAGRPDAEPQAPMPRAEPATPAAAPMAVAAAPASVPAWMPPPASFGAPGPPAAVAPAVVPAAGLAPPVPGEPAAAPPRAPTDIDSTGELQLDLIGVRPLPFAPAAARVQPASARAPARIEAPAPSLGGTAEVDVRVLAAAAAKKATPFDPAAQVPKAPRKKKGVDETVMFEGSLADLLAAKPTPFVATESAAPPPQAEFAPAPGVGETGELTAEVLQAALGKAKLPFKQRPASDPERPFQGAALTTQQFAAVRVEIELDPAKAPAILAQYGLTPETNRALDQELRAACARDPAVARAWEQAYATYLAWKREAGR